MDKKILYVEILRIFAVIFVIFNHTRDRGYVHFTLYDPGTFQYWFYMFFAVFAGVSVPIFFMISGMMLLGKQETIGYIWKKRIPKYVVILLVFSFFYYLRDIYFDLNALSAGVFLKKVYSTGTAEPLWFLYAYITFLILLPFIRKIARDITDREFVYLLLIQFVFGFAVTVLQYRLSEGTLHIHRDLDPVTVTNTLVFYPVTGYYLGCRLKKVTNRILLISFGAFVITTAATMLMTDYKIGLTGDITERGITTFFASGRPYQVIFIFLLARRLFEDRKFNKPAEKIITNLGGCVFGIYLIEDVVRGDNYFIYDAMALKINGFVAIWIYVLAVLVCCWAVVALFRFVKARIFDYNYRSRSKGISHEE